MRGSQLRESPFIKAGRVARFHYDDVYVAEMGRPAPGADHASRTLLDANDHLVPMYTRIGFRPLARRRHPLYGAVTVTAWDLLDTDHLRACRSPFLRVARQLARGTSRAA